MLKCHFNYLFYVIFILLVFTDLNNKIHTICNITLIIPTTAKTFQYCSGSIFKMINDSYTKPHEVIIIVSEYRRTVIIKKRMYGAHFILYFKIGKHNQAQNRNTGIKIAKCQYITFFDSDDYMSKARIKIIYKTFVKYPYVDIILHSYTNNKKKLYEKEKTIINLGEISYNYTPNEIYNSYFHNNYLPIYKKYCCKCLNSSLKIHNAWLSGKTNILKQYNYNESWMYYRLEDTELNYRLVMNKFNLLLIKYNLGVYIPHNQC